LAPGELDLARSASESTKDVALTRQIEQLVETFLVSEDDAATVRVLADARSIFEREGVPSVARVGDAAAYGFVLINMLGQPLEFRRRFAERVTKAATRHELPDDAVALTTAQLRQGDLEERYKSRTPTHPELRDQIERLLADDQAVRQKAGFDLATMNEVDRRTAVPLREIFDRYGVPTYDMVGVDTAKNFVILVQHQAPEFRAAVLPMLKANVDAGQADPAGYTMMYDRTERDQGRKQLYGAQLECATNTPFHVAPIEDEANVDARRAAMGLMRLELYARLVRLRSPDICGAG